MLIVALVLAVIGLAALVTAVVTSNELIAWVCIGASVIGVLLLIVDALRERSRGEDDETAEGPGEREDDTTVMPALSDPQVTEDYPEEPAETTAIKTGSTEVLTPDVAPHEQSVDPADDDLPPGTKRD
jgi:hypothetical protein